MNHTGHGRVQPATGRVLIKSPRAGLARSSGPETLIQ